MPKPPQLNTLALARVVSVLYVAGDIKGHYNPRENNKKYHSIRKLNKDNLTRIFNNKKILSYKDWEYFNT